MFATCTMITVPVRVFGSIDDRRFCSARTGVYSCPWTPATSARTGPGFVPWTTLIRSVVPSSPGRGEIVIVPDATLPGCAVTGPTVNGRDCAAAADANPMRQNTVNIERRIEILRAHCSGEPSHAGTDLRGSVRADGGQYEPGRRWAILCGYEDSQVGAGGPPCHNRLRAVSAIQ